MDRLSMLRKKISELKIDDSKYIQKIIKILHDDAMNFHAQLSCIMKGKYKTPAHLINKLKKLNNDVYFSWLNEQAAFKKAKSRLIKAKVIFSPSEKIESPYQRDYYKQYFLENMFAQIIDLIAKNLRLYNAIVIPKEWRNFVNKREKELILMARNFELEAEEQLFLLLINRLKKSKGNKLNSGKKHNAQVREFITKKFIQLIPYFFQNEKISNNLAINLSLDISNIFFEPMKPSDANKFSKDIMQDARRNMGFLSSTVADLLIKQ